MTRKISITYSWWRNDKKRIKAAHVEALEESAVDRITEQMREGVLAGELHDNIRMTDRDPADGIEYTGWWDAKPSV